MALQAPVSALLLVVLTITTVPLFQTAVATVRETMSTLTFYPNNSTIVDLPTIALDMLPSACHALVLLACILYTAYLHRKVQHLQDFHAEEKGRYRRRTAIALARGLLLAVGCNRYERMYHDIVQRYDGLCKGVSNMHCAHGKMKITPEGWVSHTCCMSVDGLLSQNHAQGTTIRHLKSKLKLGDKKPRVVLDDTTSLAMVKDFTASLPFLQQYWPLILKKAWDVTATAAGNSLELQTAATELIESISAFKPCFTIVRMR